MVLAGCLRKQGRDWISKFQLFVQATCSKEHIVELNIHFGGFCEADCKNDKLEFGKHKDIVTKLRPAGILADNLA